MHHHDVALGGVRWRGRHVVAADVDRVLRVVVLGLGIRLLLFVVLLLLGFFVLGCLLDVLLGAVSRTKTTQKTLSVLTRN